MGTRLPLLPGSGSTQRPGITPATVLHRVGKQLLACRTALKRGIRSDSSGRKRRKLPNPTPALLATPKLGEGGSGVERVEWAADGGLLLGGRLEAALPSYFGRDRIKLRPKSPARFHPLPDALGNGRIVRPDGRGGILQIFSSARVRHRSRVRA
jgi:hypothetical protein